MNLAVEASRCAPPAPTRTEGVTIKERSRVSRTTILNQSVDNRSINQRLPNNYRAVRENPRGAIGTLCYRICREEHDLRICNILQHLRHLRHLRHPSPIPRSGRRCIRISRLRRRFFREKRRPRLNLHPLSRLRS